MTPRLPRLPLVSLFLALASALSLAGADAPAPTVASAPAATAPQQKPRFIYVLHLVERLHQDTAWTKADEEAVGSHFRRLKAATESGQVLMAGRTMESGDKTFGIVIFEADNPDAAQTFAENDPAVLGGVMTVDVHPFALVLLRKS